jgi:hypothetical protein
MRYIFSFRLPRILDLGSRCFAMTFVPTRGPLSVAQIVLDKGNNRMYTIPCGPFPRGRREELRT